MNTWRCSERGTLFWLVGVFACLSALFLGAATGIRVRAKWDGGGVQWIPQNDGKSRLFVGLNVFWKLQCWSAKSGIVLDIHSSFLFFMSKSMSIVGPELLALRSRVTCSMGWASQVPSISYFYILWVQCMFLHSPDPFFCWSISRFKAKGPIVNLEKAQ